MNCVSPKNAIASSFKSWLAGVGTRALLRLCSVLFMHCLQTARAWVSIVAAYASTAVATFCEGAMTSSSQ
jgi:hypothetical protein